MSQCSNVSIERIHVQMHAHTYLQHVHLQAGSHPYNITHVVCSLQSLCEFTSHPFLFCVSVSGKAVRGKKVITTWNVVFLFTLLYTFRRFIYRCAVVLLLFVFIMDLVACMPPFFCVSVSSSQVVWIFNENARLFFFVSNSSFAILGLPGYLSPLHFDRTK